MLLRSRDDSCVHGTPSPGELPNYLGLRRGSRELAARLANGEHLILWGPTGSGKTTLRGAVQRRLCGRVAQQGYCVSAAQGFRYRAWSPPAKPRSISHFPWW
jgi:hypothetical protein